LAEPLFGCVAPSRIITVLSGPFSVPTMPPSVRSHT
jgi:hypothetical protein